MTALAMVQIEPRSRRPPAVVRNRLLPLPHTPESMDGIPYYDEEFQMAASDAHTKTVQYLSALLEQIVARTDLRWAGDHPVWVSVQTPPPNPLPQLTITHIFLAGSHAGAWER